MSLLYEKTINYRSQSFPIACGNQYIVVQDEISGTTYEGYRVAHQETSEVIGSFPFKDE